MSDAIKAICHGCGQDVGVRLNKGGFAYYSCVWCGLSFQHKRAKASEDYMRSLGAKAAGKTSENAAPAKNNAPQGAPAPAMPNKDTPAPAPVPAKPAAKSGGLTDWLTPKARV